MNEINLYEKKNEKLNRLQSPKLMFVPRIGETITTDFSIFKVVDIDYDLRINNEIKVIIVFHSEFKRD